MNETAATYADGHPLDNIRYCEYKLLLRPERFFAPERLEEYWTAIGAISKHCGVDVTTNKNAFFRHVREVLFYDTAGFDLYRNSFILRTRTFYDNGWPRRDHELTIKFRHPDAATAAAVDIRARLDGDVKIKFKQEFLPLKIEVGGIRSLFSHNCVVISPLVVLTQGMKDVTEVFPAFKRIDLDGNAPLDLVNGVAVEEIEVEVGAFDFGHGYDANATIALWRNRASEQSLVGEFAFQAKFDRLDDVHRKARERAEQFYKHVQTEAPEWVQLGTTKTALVYGLTAKGPVRDE